MARWIAFCLALACLGTALATPFHESFSHGWTSRWKHSDDSKYSGRFQAESPEALDDEALKVPRKAQHYGISTRLPTPVDPSKGLVLQYELKLAEGITCGGAYLKFVTAYDGFEPSSLDNETPYSVMFGPDKCGATNQVHLIVRHKQPSGSIEEKHLSSAPLIMQDKDTHVYTAVLDPSDNTYKVLIDGEEKKAGSLFEDFSPSFNPPEEIDDPADSKPEDWVDQAKIADPEAVKPDDWDEDAPRQVPDEEAEKPEGWLDDEPAEIDDPEAEQPEDWDEDEDGEWEPPKIANPKCEAAPGCGEWKRPMKPNPDYKGKWFAPMIDNPAYKGVWAPRKIPNPDYFTDDTPLSNIGRIGAVAVEIWTMDEGIYFDNVLVGNDPAEAEEYRDKYWAPKHAKEQEINAVKQQEDALKEAATGHGNAVSHVLEKLLDQPVLKLLRPYSGGVMDLAAGSLPIAIAVAAVPVLLLFALLRTLFGGGSKKKVTSKKPVSKPTVTQVKKQDIATPDDAEIKAADEAEENEGGPASAAGARHRTTTRPA